MIWEMLFPASRAHLACAAENHASFGCASRYGCRFRRGVWAVQRRTCFVPTRLFVLKISLTHGHSIACIGKKSISRSGSAKTHSLWMDRRPITPALLSVPMIPILSPSHIASTTSLQKANHEGHKGTQRKCASFFTFVRFGSLVVKPLCSGLIHETVSALESLQGQLVRVNRPQQERSAVFLPPPHHALQAGHAHCR